MIWIRGLGRRGALLALALLVAGCGGGSETATGSGSGSGSPTSTGTVTILHGAPLPARDNADYETPDNRLPPGVDALQFQFFDAQGNLVHGPVEFPAGTRVRVEGVPTTASRVDIDYLRNGGYPLYEDQEPVSWLAGAVAVVADPDPGPAPPPSSKWSWSVESSGRAHLFVAAGGGEPQEHLVRGVGYSPAPVGYSNRFTPAFGDLFYDTFAPNDFLDFQKVWERDLEAIRQHFNTLRTYCMVEIQFQVDAQGNAHMPIPPSSGPHFQHRKFLDACWNNGDRPVYVLVGLPLPSPLYYKDEYDNPAKKDEIAYWEANLEATVKQLKDHPAVLGFTIFNEIGGAAQYADNPTLAAFYWSRIDSISHQVKGLAPDKLVGWAFFDDPQFPVKTKAFREAHAQAIDFYGVNSFQKDDLRISLDPYLASTNGTTARPVILTEYGLPATGRTDASTFFPYGADLAATAAALAQRFGVPADTVQALGGAGQQFFTEASVLSLKDDATTQGNVANALTGTLPQAFQHPICVGLFYFEWADEWWKQESYGDFTIPDLQHPPNRIPVHAVELSVTRQEGNPGYPNDTGKPNGYWDEEGFGLHSIQVAPGRDPNRAYVAKAWEVGGNTKPDVLTRRTPIWDVLVQVFSNAPKIRSDALGN